VYFITSLNIRLIEASEIMIILKMQSGFCPGAGKGQVKSSKRVSLDRYPEKN
jgi:hypothetical protein